MFKNKGNGRYLDLVKVEDNRYYFVDINTGEEVDYAESTLKRYIEEIGTMLVKDTENFSKVEIYKEVAFHGLGLRSWMGSTIGNLKFKDEEKYANDIKAMEEMLYGEQEEEEEGLTNEEYVILRRGNYIPSWMLGGRNRINEIREYIETDGAGYHKGTYEVQDHKLANTKNINKFKQLVEEFPQILEATSSKPIGITKVGRDLAKQFVLTGIVTLSTNGLYIRKGELKDVSTIS